MSEDMDFDASPVLTGCETMEQSGLRLLQQVIAVAGGELSKPEALGHREYFIMYKHQETPNLTQGCRA
jgi:altronate hydrolase